ncbi:MAG: ABC transporter permease subunit [Nitrososphaerota archaeon]
MKARVLKALALSTAVFYVAFLLGPGFLYQTLTFPPDPYTSLANTVITASAATVAAFPIAVLLAFYAMKRGLKGLMPLITFSTAIPHTAVGLLLLPLFSRLGIVDTAIAVVISMMVVSLPIGVGSLASVFSGGQKSLDEFLQPLGLNDLHIIWLHTRAEVFGVATSIILMWLRCFSELGALLIVANRPATVGVYLFELFNREGAAASVPYALIVAFIGLAFSTLVYFVSKRSWVV